MDFTLEDLENMQDEYIYALGVLGSSISSSIEKSMGVSGYGPNSSSNVSIVGTFASDSRAFMGATLKHQDFMRELNRRFFSTTTYQLSSIQSSLSSQSKKSEFLLQRLSSKLSFIVNNPGLIALEAVAKTFRGFYGLTSSILFGMKDDRTGTQKIVDSIHRLTNLLAYGGILPSKGFFSGGITGILSTGFKRGIGLGADRAARTEEKFARGESTTIGDRLSQRLNQGKYRIIGRTQGSRNDSVERASNNQSEKLVDVLKRQTSVIEKQQYTLMSIRDILYNETPIAVSISNMSVLENAIRGASGSDVSPTATGTTDNVNVVNLSDKASSPFPSLLASTAQQVDLAKEQANLSGESYKLNSVIADAANDSAKYSKKNFKETEKLRKTTFFMGILRTAMGAITGVLGTLLSPLSWLAAGGIGLVIKTAFQSGWGVVKGAISGGWSVIKSAITGLLPNKVPDSKPSVTSKKPDSRNATGPGILKRTGNFLSRAKGSGGPLAGIITAGSQILMPDKGDSKTDTYIKAGSRGVGASVGSVIGAGLGSFIPGPGTFAGSVIGGYLGDKLGQTVGDALTTDFAKSIGNGIKTATGSVYDGVLGNKKTQDRSRELRTSIEDNNKASSELTDTLKELSTNIKEMNKQGAKKDFKDDDWHVPFSLSDLQSAHVSGD